jgi:hypothetical protein
MKSPFQQFIAAVKELRDGLLDIPKKLSLLDQDIQEQTAEISKVREATEQRQGTTPEVRAILHTPESVEIEQREHRARQQRYQKRNLAATWAGVVVVAAYTTFAALQWNEMRRSNRAAVADFRQDERAWMAFRFMEGNLTFTPR